VLRKSGCPLLSFVPKSSFGEHKKPKSTRFGLRTIAKYIENLDFIFCQSFMLPKRRFLKKEQTLQTTFSKHFSTFCSPNPVLTPLKSASKMRSERFVRPSQIFVWEG
jgi:hypothetical protein